MEFLLYILGGVLLGVVLACVEAHFRGNRKKGFEK